MAHAMAVVRGAMIFTVMRVSAGLMFCHGGLPIPGEPYTYPGGVSY
jgi:hypothetical protein